MSDEGATEWRWTVPNALCIARILGLVPLLWFAHGGRREAFVWLLVALLATDWLDGLLAKALDQETEVGASLDSVADAAMYAALAVSFWWLEAPVIRTYLPWFLAVAASWLLSAAVSLARFGRLPSWHSLAAKASWLAVGVAALLVLLADVTRPVPWALGLVVLTNLEAAAIGGVLPEWRANVPSVRHALRIRRHGDDRSPGGSTDGADADLSPTRPSPPG